MEYHRLLIVWTDTGASASVTSETRDIDGRLASTHVTECHLDEPLVVAAVARWQELTGRLFDR
jgi:hypothetical protein